MTFSCNENQVIFASEMDGVFNGLFPVDDCRIVITLPGRRRNALENISNDLFRVFRSGVVRGDDGLISFI